MKFNELYDQMIDEALDPWKVKVVRRARDLTKELESMVKKSKYKKIFQKLSEQFDNREPFSEKKTTEVLNTLLELPLPDTLKSFLMDDQDKLVQGKTLFIVLENIFIDNELLWTGVPD